MLFVIKSGLKLSSETWDWWVQDNALTCILKESESLGYITEMTFTIVGMRIFKLIIYLQTLITMAEGSQFLLYYVGWFLFGYLIKYIVAKRRWLLSRRGEESRKVVVEREREKGEKP